jgi:hypothetical protein
LRKYIGYAQDLRGLRDSRGFETAAQVDMALWTLQVGAVEGRLPDSARINRSWKEDRELRSIRVTNLASRLFDDMDRLDLAEALAPSRAELAGQLAALAFEAAVREYTKAKQDQDLLAIISAKAPEAVRSTWQHCRILRNRAVHGQPLQSSEVKGLIKITREIGSTTKNGCRNFVPNEN